MVLTLQLEDYLAEELRQEAHEEGLSVETLANHLVRDALQERIAQKHWRALNHRRLELIARKQHTPLTAQEHQELSQLQSQVCEIAAPFDRVLLQTVTRLRQEVAAFQEEPRP